MTQEKVMIKKKKRGDLKMRALLLIMQLLLPFGLYLSLRWGWSIMTFVIAAVFFLSMVFLVWLG